MKIVLIYNKFSGAIKREPKLVSCLEKLINERLASDDQLISNNRYELNLLQVGTRKSLKEGRLYVYMAKCTTRWCVLRVALKALFNKLDQEKDFILHSSQQIRLESRKSKISVALDGEVYAMGIVVTVEDILVL